MMRMTALVSGVLKHTQARILKQIDLSQIAAPSPGELSRTLETHTSSLARQDARNRLSLDFDMLEIQALGEVDSLALKAALEALGAQVAAFNAKAVNGLVGINVRGAAGIGASIDAFRDRNIALIKSLVGGQITDVRTLLEGAEATGLRVEDLRDQIQERFGVSDSRAELIARDQTLKLNGQITQLRQVNAGVEKYVWTTSGDERVREEHAALEGQVISWDDPPSVGHPGEDINCRCTAFPIIEELDGDAG